MFTVQLEQYNYHIYETNFIPSKIKDYSQFGKVRLNLGAWCNIYDGKEKTLNENIVKHPWKNSYQFERDFTKISKIYKDA